MKMWWKKPGKVNLGLQGIKVNGKAEKPRVNVIYKSTTAFGNAGMMIGKKLYKFK